MILIDTSALIGVINPKDQYHRHARRHLRELKTQGPICIPRIVMIEAMCHLTRFKVEHSIRVAGLSSIRSLDWPVIDHEKDDFLCADQWWMDYADWPIDYPDAITLSTASRLNASRIWMYDHQFAMLVGKVTPNISPIGSGFSEWKL